MRRLLIGILGLLAIPSVLAQGESRWAIAIHGGAGALPRDTDPMVVETYRNALEEGLALGAKLLMEGKPGVDVVEAVVAFFEDDSLFNAGKGAVFTHEGLHELDAAIMDGKTLACGAVSGVRTVKNPIHLARLVMDRSRHVFFTGEGAERFATEMGVERVDPTYFFTRRRYEAWKRALQKDSYGMTPPDEEKGTVGCVVLDRQGNLVAATSTGGLTNKRYGRVGDVPIVGAGTYANNRTCAISCTGHGEAIIRNTVAHDVSTRMEYAGQSLTEAAEIVIQERLGPGAGGLIGVSREGEIVMEFSSAGMFRGAADSGGRFEVAIWRE